VIGYTVLCAVHERPELSAADLRSIPQKYRSLTAAVVSPTCAVVKVPLNVARPPAHQSERFARHDAPT